MWLLSLSHTIIHTKQYLHITLGWHGVLWCTRIGSQNLEQIVNILLHFMIFWFVVVIVVVIVKSVRCSLIMCFLLCGITMESKDCFIFILGENSQHILTQFSIQKTFTIFIGTYGPTTLYERIHRTERNKRKTNIKRRLKERFSF